jgi:predicted dithiol-disulfide oxidoreductase (DUF899 family)
MPNNKVVSSEEWLKARLELLAAEKEFTRQRDALTRRRMAMPWERVEESYQFEGPGGALSLADLFEGRSQLIKSQAMHDALAERARTEVRVCRGDQGRPDNESRHTSHSHRSTSGKAIS